MRKWNNGLYMVGRARIINDRCVPCGLFIFEHWENHILKMDWSWLPRIKSWVKMSRRLKICQINSGNGQTHQFVENKHGKWTASLLQVSREAQPCNYGTERTVPPPGPLLRNSTAKSPPHGSHRMHLDWELEKSRHTHALIITFTIAGKM